VKVGARHLPSERGEAPSDAAVLAWASVDPAVAERVNAVEEKRIGALKRLAGRPQHAELAYLMWLGFVARGQRVPQSRQRFPAIARQILDLLLSSRGVSYTTGRGRRRRARRPRGER
jgi:hypothetical protein